MFPSSSQMFVAEKGREILERERERERETRASVCSDLVNVGIYDVLPSSHTVAARLIMGCASRVRTSFRLGRSFTPFFYRVPRAIDSGRGPKGIRRLRTGPWREARPSSFICSRHATFQNRLKNVSRALPRKMAQLIIGDSKLSRFNLPTYPFPFA